MKENFDQELLSSKKIDTKHSEPILHQILRIAVYDEYFAYEAYSKVLEQFGAIEPFVQIVENEKNHYVFLIKLLEKYQVPVPINDWALKITMPQSLLECAELGVASEINNIRLYDYLLEFAEEDDVKDALYFLQAASYNYHLPTFRALVSKLFNEEETSTQDFSLNQDDLLAKLQQFQELGISLANGELDQDKLTKLLSTFSPSFLGGLVLGGAGSFFASSMIKTSEEEQKEDNDEDASEQGIDKN